MKRILLLLIISILSFAGGEISFKKQKEKLVKFENAQLEAIKNKPVQNETEEAIELDSNKEELKFKKKRTIIMQD